MDQPPLFRAALARTQSTEHVLLLVFHHVISDGESQAILLSELSELYAAFHEQRPSRLPPLHLRFSDFAAWQRDRMEREPIHLAYWKEKLAGAPALELRLDRARPALQSHRGTMLTFLIDRELKEAVKTAGRERGATLYMMLLAAFEVMLYRQSGQEDFCVGTPTAGRSRPELESIVGFFANTLALRVDLSGKPDLEQVVERVKTCMVEAFAHEEAGFGNVFDAVRPAPDPSRSPLFQVFFSMPSSPGHSLELGGLQVEPVASRVERSKFDLTLFVVEIPEGIGCAFEYCTDLFEANTMQRMAESFRDVLRTLVTHPRAALDDEPKSSPSSNWKQHVG
jgi:hypothetical protein